MSRLKVDGPSEDLAFVAASQGRQLFLVRVENLYQEDHSLPRLFSSSFQPRCTECWRRFGFPNEAVSSTFTVQISSRRFRN